MATIVIMPGGFHPFHAGHYALYKSAVEAFPDAEVYVAATNDTSARPFPFPVKEKLARLAGVAPNRFVQVRSPFKAEEITTRYNPLKDTLIFVRSAKDSKSPPIPGGVKRDGSPSYLQPLEGQTQLQPFAKHAYMAYLPTVEFGPGMTSATEIRAAWPQLNEKRKTALVMSLYPRTQGNAKLAATVVGLLDAAIGSQVDEDLSRRGFLRGLGAAAVAGAAGSAMAQSQPVDVSQAFANMRKDDPRVQHNKDIDEMARAIYDQMVTLRGQPIDRRQQQMWMTIAREKAAEKLSKYAPRRPVAQPQSSGFPSQGSERRVSRNIDNFESQGMAEGLNEFAPAGSDDGDNGFSEETLKRLAAQWYNGDEDPRVEQTLAAAGWEIGQDEGYDDEPGVFVVQAGDINGNSYISWPAHELKQGMAEGSASVDFKGRPVDQELVKKQGKYWDQAAKEKKQQELKRSKQLRQQGVAEGVNDYLWHGSREEHDVLYPRQANDTGGKEESNKNAVYATPNAKVAIAMGLTTPGSDTGMFPNDPQMVLFKGNIRKGQMVYLHKVPKDLFIKHNSREWYSKPGVEEVKPIEVVKVPVDKYLNLIRQATPQDLELRKKYMKEGVAEGDVVPFKRPSTTLTWQDVPKNILLLANDWFWASEDDSGLAATIDPNGVGNGTANAVKYAAAKLQQHGWSIDFNDEYDKFGEYNLRLTNRRGQTVLLPIEDAQDFKGWAAGTNPVNENQGWAATLEESHVLDLTKNFSNHARVHAQVVDVLPSGKVKLRIVAADPIPGKKPTVVVGQPLTMAMNYLRRAPQVAEEHNFGRNVYFQVPGEKLPLAQAVKQSINFHPTNKDGVWKFSVMKNQNPNSVQGIIARLEQMFGPRVSIDAVGEAVLGTAGAGMTAGYQRRENQPVDEDYIDEKWSTKYKRSIDCSNPRGFSQRAHCAGRKK